MSLNKLGGVTKIGLIAGNGKFPLMFAHAAASHGLRVVAIAIKKDTSAWLPRLVEKTYWLSLKDFGKMFSIFKSEGISKVIMAGQVNPKSLFYRDLGDDLLKKLLAAVRDKRPETVFGAVGNMLAEHGIDLVDSTIFLEKFLPHRGTLTRREPDQRTWEDVRFGYEMAKKVANLDIGQTLVVRDKAIVAVEAIEGTDAAIRRGGKVAGGGVVVVKVSKPNQDMRFDIPVVGPRTIKNLIRVRARCLAIEADKTLMIDRELCVRLAERSRIAIVAL
jgi:UDP-2,3-diacylglucosamine hydrolase